ncbi:hypothetical protein EW145_g2400 [Phellinidium pouzarii]|uniref:Dynamin GTPase domain-containing protein n=1 Tax=Phellinidium pouzarii TaxID=167371 RepID=A0A4V3XDA1_9AGAM|nr:hypothetical protein EW145_g2400 [Phellinidium pouzarii]
MECRLSYSEEPFKAQVLLRFEKDELGVPFDKVNERKFGRLLHDKTELEDMLRKAQLAILNLSVSAERFLDLDLSILDPGEPPFGSKAQLQFFANVVCIDISSPESTDLSFIDLPGIISNVAEGEDLGNIELIKDLVKEHISGNALILLTITMRGVLTKPDTLQEGEHSAWIKVLAGETNVLAHGYYVTKQPAVSELREKLSYEEGQDRECKFFE